MTVIYNMSIDRADKPWIGDRRFPDRVLKNRGSLSTRRIAKLWRWRVGELSFLSGLEASVPNILSIKSFRNYSEMF